MNGQLIGSLLVAELIVVELQEERLEQQHERREDAQDRREDP